MPPPSSTIPPDRLRDHRIALGIFLLTAVTYGWFAGGGGWNQNVNLDLTRAIVEQRTVRIDAFASNTGDRSFHGGHVYSNKSPGVSLLAAIPYAVLRAVESSGALEPDDPMLLSLNLYLCTFAVCGLLGAAIPATIYLQARRWMGSGRRWALTVALTIAFGTPLFPFATVLFAHVPSAAFLLLACHFAREERSFSRIRAGFFSGLAAMTNYLCGPAILPVAILTALSNRSRKDAGASPSVLRILFQFTAGALPPLALLAAYQRAAFGSFFTTPVETMDRTFVSQGAWLGVIQLPSLEALMGITVSPYRGLFYVAPVLVFGLGGIVILARRGRRLDAAIIATFTLFFIGFNATFNGWEGGYTFGPRYLIPLIPLLGIAMAACEGLWKPLFAGAAVLSVVFNFAATAVDPTPPASIPRPLTQYVLPILVNGFPAAGTPLYPPWVATIDGHTSVSPHSADQIVPLIRHSPDSAPSQWAAFNLGEIVFGAGSPASLIPIALWMILGAALLRRACLVRDER